MEHKLMNILSDLGTAGLAAAKLGAIIALGLALVIVYGVLAANWKGFH